MRQLRLRAIIDQLAAWPNRGNALLAQFDADTVVVYQAFNRKIGRYAVEHQRFGGGFSMDRMSWIKPGFLWMMHRSEWGTADEQTAVLAVWVKRPAFDDILARAIPSRFEGGNYPTEAAWRSALAESDVRLQWDPDYDPRGIKVKRRVLRLGLSGDTLRAYAHDWIAEIQDISEYVRQQAAYRNAADLLLTPVEKPYAVTDAGLARRIGLG